MTMTAENPYEARQRTIKAFKIARVLAKLVGYFPQYDADTLADPDLTTPEVRAHVAEMAGVNVPSDATWAEALDWLRQFDVRG